MIKDEVLYYGGIILASFIGTLAAAGAKSAISNIFKGNKND